MLWFDGGVTETWPNVYEWWFAMINSRINILGKLRAMREADE
ncbi:hypothetical protein GCM10025875_20290 [Litorihabitans aurantiacus]|uniref:Uncharacterized protein n=1 Tax=Litorihabitans aurantiacus TaxID=1930061 RepID=A0AA38CTP4_9MICO|nr:hypothetical protein GCM10025875_20290 [Litorihabitans aurantiacus]